MPSYVDLEGREFAPTAPLHVSAASIADFAEALGDANPAYRGADAVAPPTFVAVPAARAWRPLFAAGAFGLQLAHTIHVDQGFEFVRPVRVGDELCARLRVGRVRERGPAAWLSLRIDVEDAAARPVCVCRATMLHVDPAGGPRERSDERPAHVPPDAPSDEPAADIPLWLPGAALPGLDVALTRAMLRRYAEVSGDDNPIHQDDAAAAALGLPGVIAHGLLTLGLALRAVTDACGDPARVASWRARFVRPLPVPLDGTVLHVAGRVTQVQDGLADVAVTAGDALGAALAQVRTEATPS